MMREYRTGRRYPGAITLIVEYGVEALSEGVGLTDKQTAAAADYFENGNTSLVGGYRRF